MILNVCSLIKSTSNQQILDTYLFPTLLFKGEKMLIFLCFAACFCVYTKLALVFPVLMRPFWPTVQVQLPMALIELCTFFCRSVEVLNGTKPQGQLCHNKLSVCKASRCPLHTITLVGTLQWLSRALSESDILLAGESRGRLSKQAD